MTPFPIVSYTMTSAAGAGLDATRAAIADRRSGLRRNDFPHSTVDTWIGRSAAVDAVAWQSADALWKSRNNALAGVALGQDGFLDQVLALRDSLGAARIGVIVGTSTSSVGRTEEGYRALEDERMPEGFRQKRVHNPHSLGDYVARCCELSGPAMTVSTACSSSAKVFATGARWLALRIVDAVLLGGVDSLCLSVLHGFNSLELTSTDPCQPFDAQRKGISIGEAGAFALMRRLEDVHEPDNCLLGYGESSDAHHMSHPHPQGLGAKLAMTAALERAALDPGQIDYLNLHGTASRANDLIEAQAVGELFPDSLRISSTKGWTGHTLGAAGILEALIALDTLATGLAPGTLNLATPDPELPREVMQDNLCGAYRYAATNSFGFGGNNCSLLFGPPA